MHLFRVEFPSHRYSKSMCTPNVFFVLHPFTLFEKNQQQKTIRKSPPVFLCAMKRYLVQVCSMNEFANSCES